MVKTPPYQKRGKCGHFMPQFDTRGSCFGCRAKCKGLDPCAQGADTTQCSACALLTEQQWSHKILPRVLLTGIKPAHRVNHLRSRRQKNWRWPVKISREWTTRFWILNRKTPVPVHLSPASALSLAYRLHYPHRMSRRLLLLWSGTTVYDWFFSPFQGAAPSVSDSHTGHSTFRISTTHNSWQAISCGKNGGFVIPTTTEGCLNNRDPTDS